MSDVTVPVPIPCPDELETLDVAIPRLAREDRLRRERECVLGFSPDLRRAREETQATDGGPTNPSCDGLTFAPNAERF